MLGGMKTIVCVTCQSTNIKKNGTTSSGKQRYYCKNCKTSFTHEYDSTFKDFALFLDYVTHTHSQNDYTIAGRTLREKTRRFWQYWPLPPLVNESYDIVFIDGIYITRKIVVLIACTTTHIIGWYVARSQTTAAYTALLSRIAAPTIAVSDGGSGLRKACKNTWPNTKIQRCLFHIYMTIRTAPTLHPRLLPGKQLLRIGTSLLKVKLLTMHGNGYTCIPYGMRHGMTDSMRKLSSIPAGKTRTRVLPKQPGASTRSFNKTSYSPTCITSITTRIRITSP